MKHHAHLLIAASVLCAPLAAAGECDDRGRVSFRQPAAETADSGETVVPSTDELAERAVLRFGMQDYDSLTIGGGIGVNLEDDPATDSIGYAAYQYFLSDEFEIIGELAILYSNQIGDNATAVNPVLAFRYHYWSNEDWSLYADAGIGFLFATDEIPAGGTEFNFTPRAGLGFTRRLGGEGLRLIGGLRWHHISNARIDGDDQNPDRDGVMLYVGLNFPI